MSKKVLLLLGMLLIVMISSVMATESRIMSLGNPYGFIRDNTDIFYYPGSIHKYVNRIDLELRSEGNVDNWSIGANLPMKKNVLGVYLNQPTGFNVDPYFYDYWDKHNDYEWGDLDISQKIQFIYGFKEKFAVGFGMAIDSKTDPVWDPDESDYKKNIAMSAKYFELIGGMSDEKMDLGVSVFMPMASVENEVSEEEQTLSGIGFGLNGRYYFYEQSRLTAMALGNLYYSGLSDETKLGPTDWKNTYGSMMFDLGVGANYTINENNTLILGIYPFRINTFTAKTPNGDDPDENDEYSETYLYIPEYKLALESQLTSWLTARFGASQEFHFYTETDKEYEEDEYQNKEYDSSFYTELGFGIKYKRFFIDGVICDELLFNGPQVVGGNDPGMSTKLSLGYNF